MKLESQALAELHKELWEPLVRYALRMLGCVALAEDVVQDVFLTLWRRADDVPIETGMRAYLFGAVHRRALHARRSEYRVHERESVSSFSGVARVPGSAD